MITVKDIYDFLDKIAPFDTQEDFDNSGMLIGDINAETKTIAVMLDVTADNLNEAVKNGADLIISHHPVIFDAQKDLLCGNIAYEAAKSGINVISAHTSYDAAKGGVSDVMCEILKLKKVKPFDTKDSSVPMVRLGETEQKSSEDFAKFVSEQFDTHVQYTNGKDIKTVAVCGGAGGCFLDEIIESGIDAYVTGEAKYHEILKAKEAGITLVVAGHYETENPAMEVLADKIQNKFKDIKVIFIKSEPALLCK